MTGSARRRIEGARVIKVWDPDPIWAERLAETCDIPEVCETPEACSEGVDGVVIVDDGSGEHSQYAAHPLKKGIPTFCDKPLAMTARRAQEIADLVRETGTPFMSASSLRFVPDIVALRDGVADLGEVHLATAVCGNELVYYGIHALSMVYGVFGGGAISCVNVGQPGRNIVRVRFQKGRDLVLMVAEREFMRAGYQISVYGTGGWRTVNPDLADLYYFLQERFIHMVRTGEEPVPVEEEVEVIAVLEAGKRSLTEGREVAISEVR
ncbi:MAG: Gfo/Idh/MocA family oxidoreductase [Candidatus Latescibacteria bacterium]|nr:Gfo/Idh/MocA family oxidoreductase [Candidatus Latescibacterota bacterium]